MVERDLLSVCSHEGLGIPFLFFILLRELQSLINVVVNNTVFNLNMNSICCDNTCYFFLSSKRTPKPYLCREVIPYDKFNKGSTFLFNFINVAL